MNRLLGILAAGTALLCGCAAADGTGSGSPWALGVDQAVTWETVHVLAQTSPDSIPDEYATKEVHPVLAFRCAEGGNGMVSMQIDWQRFVSSFSTEAGFRVDDGARDWIKLGVDDGNRVTLSRSDADVDRLLAALAAGDTLDVEIAPYSEPAVSVRFDLEGFADGLARLRAACN
jgi:hypothetical protein